MAESKSRTLKAAPFGGLVRHGVTMAPQRDLRLVEGDLIQFILGWIAQFSSFDDRHTKANGLDVRSGGCSLVLECFGDTAGGLRQLDLQSRGEFLGEANHGASSATSTACAWNDQG